MEQTTDKTKRTSKLAITSLIFGILSLINFILYPSGGIIHSNANLDNLLFASLAIIAFALGIISIIKVSKSSYLKGIGFGIAGLVTTIPTILEVLGYFIMTIFS